MYKTWNYKNDGCWAATKAAPEGAPPVTAVAEAEEEERQAGEAGRAAGGPLLEVTSMWKLESAIKSSDAIIINC